MTSVRISGRRAGQRFDAERNVATEALIFLGDLDPEAIGPNIAHATHYEPTPVGDLEALLAYVPSALERATFVDLGSGLGRAVLLAAARPFRQVVGVEFSPALHAIARDNLAAIDRASLRCRDVRLVCADADAYRFPRGDLVVYLFNPFDGAVLAGVLDRLAVPAQRDVTIVYHTPVERAIVEAHPAFELVAEDALGAIYARVATTIAPRRP
ncbi:MAG: class I SAM-dependent methyltransferase [Vulcanimicrobiaceae bacterium]